MSLSPLSPPSLQSLQSLSPSSLCRRRDGTTAFTMLSRGQRYRFAVDKDKTQAPDMLPMPDRLLSVTAYTTLDLLDGEAEAHEFTESAYAVVNATAPRKQPDHVKLEVELDSTQLEQLTPHADRIRLTPEEARTLAADLEKYAEKVDAYLADES